MFYKYVKKSCSFTLRFTNNLISNLFEGCSMIGGCDAAPSPDLGYPVIM